MSVEIKEEKNLIEQYKKDVQSEAYRLTIEDINQRLDAGEKISDEEKEEIIEDNLEKVFANTMTLSPNEFHKMICKILMLVATFHWKMGNTKNIMNIKTSDINVPNIINLRAVKNP